MSERAYRASFRGEAYVKAVKTLFEKRWGSFKEEMTPKNTSASSRKRIRHAESSKIESILDHTAS